MDNRPIGVFDSGVGGLTVASKVMRALPNEEIIYFGDTARVPYGSKSTETITKFSKQIMHFLMTKDVKAVIIACNTICASSYNEISDSFDVPCVDVIGPGVEACLRATKNNIVGVISTEATMRSGQYVKRLKEMRPGIEVYARACPLFTPLAEEGWTNNTVARLTAEMYLQDMRGMEIDTLVLACTHYPLLSGCIQDVVGNIKVVNPAGDVATKMKALLESQGLSREEKSEPVHTFYFSDNTKKFDMIARLLLDKRYDAVMVDIERY